VYVDLQGSALFALSLTIYVARKISLSLSLPFQWQNRELAYSLDTHIEKREEKQNKLRERGREIRWRMEYERGGVREIKRRR
jgi:hypothetical protein